MFMYMLYRTVVVVLGGVTTVRLISSTFCTESTVTPHEPSGLSPRARRPSYRRRADALKRLPEKIQEGAAKRARAAPARETWEAPSVSELFHFRTRPSSYPILSQPWLLRTVSAGPAGGHCVLQEAEAACELKVVLGKKCSEKHEVTMIRRS